jgi:Zn-dependent peptidase ImmA (M78 family)
MFRCRAEIVDNPTEREANYFAAELLMPGELIEICIQANIKSTQELAARFKVSEQAMTFRLINLGYL